MLCVCNVCIIIATALRFNPMKPSETQVLFAVIASYSFMFIHPQHENSHIYVTHHEAQAPKSSSTLNA